MARVVVVGAGIIGASVAYHLAKGGADVTIVEKNLPASGASGASFAWIGKGPTPSRPAQAMLRELVLSDYRRLERELPGVQVRWTGSVQWNDDDSAEFQEPAGESSPIGPAELLELEPHLRSYPAMAHHSATDGALDPVAVVRALVAGAELNGVRLLVNTTVHDWDLEGHRVVGLHTSAGTLRADTVVIAAGTDSAALCDRLGYHLAVAASPALLISFSAALEVVHTLVANDNLEVRQTADGTFRVASEYTGETTDEELGAVGRNMLTRLQATFTGAENVRLEGVQVGVRPMPEGGDPIIGPVPGAVGAYVAVMHSGVTLAATVGRLVAAEIIDGRPADELNPVRAR